MKDLAPDIIRQRLLIEGYYETEANEDSIKRYFSHITEELGLRTYGEPIIHSLKGQGRDTNQGYDCFVPLIDSGISLYIWTPVKFLSAIIYTCKAFDNGKAVEKTKEFWGIKQAEWEPF
jgi:hypothetical protein